MRVSRLKSVMCYQFEEFGQFVAIVCILLWIINNDKLILHIILQV